MVLSFWVHCLCEFEREIAKSEILKLYQEQIEILYII